MRGVGLAVAIGALFAHSALAQQDVFALVDRAVAYVDTFQRDFGSVVAEERYEQTLRSVPGGTTMTRRSVGPSQTVLVSDFLLVQVAGEGWLPFRDVFERDGQPVRDRQERLAEIFLTAGRDALEQARAVMDEGARYNIGGIARNINVPTLPLAFLTDLHRHRFDFKAGKPDRSNPGTVVEFKERTRPTFVVTEGGRDLPVEGRLWIDETAGTILRTELEAIDTAVEAHITVTYEYEEGLGIWVPARMEERYRKRRDPTEVRGVATYSKFRRFQVITSEELAR